MPVRKQPLIPPGGFAGFAQQTPAVQALLAPKRPTRKRRRKKVAKKRPTRRRSTRTTRRTSTARKRKPARLVKGSAAAKRHMAKLRRMRKKKRG